MVFQDRFCRRAAIEDMTFSGLTGCRAVFEILKPKPFPTYQFSFLSFQDLPTIPIFS
jgi:hypothetical protein